MDVHSPSLGVGFPLSAVTAVDKHGDMSPTSPASPSMVSRYTSPVPRHTSRMGFGSRQGSFNFGHGPAAASALNTDHLPDGLRSRRQSSVNMQGFLNGVGFAIRCPDNADRRGESRSASRAGSHYGDRRATPLPPPVTVPERTLADEEEGFLSDGDSEVADDYNDFAWTLEEDEDGSAKVFEEGDRIGVGLFHNDSPVQDCFPELQTICSTKRLEIVRKLGSGSYAVVYLARAILWDPEVDGVDSEDGEAGIEFGGDVVYGQEVALKCLCKHNLSEELLEVQRFEATLHQQVPAHPNIVAMHGALETDTWLFLVLEYCPGQDLFYWLEQAKDHEDVDQHMHPSASFNTAGAQQRRLADEYSPESHSATPPSPTLLSITAMSSLLSRRRLRLISRMFIQMCDAVQACHDVGISHRDIKPENFICCEDSNTSGLDRRVTVKITDWGLGTQDEECGDFDCGSKPYMAYECRNNLAPTYRPRAADIWSLGIVLLNLLFHRCPWADPTVEDPDFASYKRNPVDFLMERFQGIGKDVARYLATNVLNCEGPRVTAKAFAEWATRLVSYMSDPTPMFPRSVAVSDAALPLPSAPRLASSDLRRVSLLLAASDSSKARPRSSLLAQCIAHGDSGSTTERASPLSQASDLPADPQPVLITEIRLQPSPIISSMPLPQIVDSPPALEGLSLEPEDVASTDADALALAAKAKRRKRGARRGRNAARAGAAADGDAKQAVETVSPRPNVGRQYHDVPRVARPTPSQTHSDFRPANAPKATGFGSRFKGAFKGGNADLDMFVQRVRERDAYSEAVASAPAKMQGSTNSFGTNSARSNASWSADDEPRSHWASTSNRRERLGRRSQVESPSVYTTSSPTSTSSSGRMSASYASSNTSYDNPPYRSPTRKVVDWNAMAPVAHDDKALQSKGATLSRIDEQMPIRKVAEQQVMAKQSMPPPPPPPTGKAATQASEKPKSSFLKGLFR